MSNLITNGVFLDGADLWTPADGTPSIIFDGDHTATDDGTGSLSVSADEDPDQADTPTWFGVYYNQGALPVIGGGANDFSASCKVSASAAGLHARIVLSFYDGPDVNDDNIVGSPIAGGVVDLTGDGSFDAVTLSRHSIPPTATHLSLKVEAGRDTGDAMTVFVDDVVLNDGAYTDPYATNPFAFVSGADGGMLTPKQPKFVITDPQAGDTLSFDSDLGVWVNNHS